MTAGELPETDLLKWYELAKKMDEDMLDKLKEDQYLKLRVEFTKAALSGLCHYLMDFNRSGITRLAEHAVEIADATLAELNKKP